MVPSAVKRRPVNKERDWVRGSCRNLRLKTSATAARGVTASATSMTTSMKALKKSPTNRLPPSSRLAAAAASRPPSKPLMVHGREAHERSELEQPPEQG